MDKVDCVVIGAGVVGLAIARALAARGREVLILEAESAFGTHTSARNSEVIHAGLSYPPGSLKAKLCVQGKERLYAYCAERGVAHQRIGKYIIASEESDMGALAKYVQLAEAAGVRDLRSVGVAELHEQEPSVVAIAGLYSPSTGIVDSHALMLSLLGDAERDGANLAVNSPVISGEVRQDGIALRIGGAEPTELLCRTVINAAGLYAHRVAGGIAGLAAEHVPEVRYAIGHYYTLSGRSPFRHLVYPVSRQAGLRVHVTLDLAGQCRFGPDLRWLDDVDYEFQHDYEPEFYRAIRRYYPDLRDGTLTPGYTGIRPRLDMPERPLHALPLDFRIDGPQTHGVNGLVNLFGIESPGLTSSLAIGEYVAEGLSA